MKYLKRRDSVINTTVIKVIDVIYRTLSCFAMDVIRSYSSDGLTFNLVVSTFSIICSYTPRKGPSMTYDRKTSSVMENRSRRLRGNNKSIDTCHSFRDQSSARSRAKDGLSYFSFGIDW